MSTRARKKPPAPASKWKNRIVGQGEVAAKDLVANPENWRKHPKNQKAALEGVLSEVGWVQRVIVNKRTGHMVDGHARVELAPPEEKIPVLYVDLSPEEEALVLATLDPLSAMALRDDDVLRKLATKLPTVDNDAIAALLQGTLPKDRQGEEEPPPLHTGAALKDLAPTKEEREKLKGRRILVEYSGGKDSTAATLWVKRFFPKAEVELMYVDLGADWDGFYLYLHRAAKQLGYKLVVLRSPRNLLDLFLEKGKWPGFIHPYCHEQLHEALDSYVEKQPAAEVAVVRGGRLQEKAASGRKQSSRFLEVPRLKDYTFFQPLYFADKGAAEKIVDSSGFEIWEGYKAGMQRTACRICPGQKPSGYAAMRAHFPEVWREMQDLEKRLGGPGCWQASKQFGRNLRCKPLSFEEAANKGQAAFEAGNYPPPQ